MTLQEAIEARHSVWVYKDQSLAEDVVKVLVHAKMGSSMIGYTQMELGIAKYHFEIGAEKENFEWI